MRWTRPSELVRCVLLAALPCSLGAQAPLPDAGKSAQTKPVSVVAATQLISRQGAFKVNDVNWTCKGSRCSAAAPSSAVVAACRNLAREVGTILSFSVANQDLPATELQQCNNLQSQRLVTATDFPSRALPLPTAPERAAASPRAPSSKAPGATATSGPFAPVAIRTAPLALTGTGVAELSFRFTPVSIRTSPLTLTGMGIAEITYRFTPIAIRTAPLTLTGTGRAE